MRLAATALALLIALVAAGCGDDDDGPDPVPTQTIGPPATEPPRAPGVEGPLEATSFGPVVLSMTEEEVLDAFGEPDRRVIGDDDELRSLVWTSGGWETIVGFDPETGVDGFRTDNPSLETPQGHATGDRWAPILEELGEQLADPEGEPASTDDGDYLLSLSVPGSIPAISFRVRDGRITEVAGGLRRPPRR